MKKGRSRVFAIFGGNSDDKADVRGPGETRRRLDVASWQEAHGRHGNAEWPLPVLVAASEEPNRPSQGNHILANEYLDEPEVLEAKMAVVAELIMKSKYCMAYTGAGISRPAGIADYATRAKNSVASNGVPKLSSNLDAQPTYSHYVLTALERAGQLQMYVQQNHDGLPQKAGFPQAKMNEIHGAWYDPSNRVVQFNENLRTDLFHEMLRAVETKEDLCLCMGTSLSGMNADRVARTCAKRACKAKTVDGRPYLGTVLINLQQTCLDKTSAVRIWAKIDDAMRILAEKLELKVGSEPLPEPKKDIYYVPYNEKGLYDPLVLMTLDLRIGKKVRIAPEDALNYNRCGVVQGRDKEGNWLLQIDHTKLLGRWWAAEAEAGTLSYIPIVNVDAELTPVGCDYHDGHVTSGVSASK